MDFVSAEFSGDGDGPDLSAEDPGDNLNGTDEGEDSYHGTHIARTIGAETDNASGVAGVLWEARQRERLVQRGGRRGQSETGPERGFVLAKQARQRRDEIATTQIRYRACREDREVIDAVFEDGADARLRRGSVQAFGHVSGAVEAEEIGEQRHLGAVEAGDGLPEQVVEHGRWW